MPHGMVNEEVRVGMDNFYDIQRFDRKRRERKLSFTIMKILVTGSSGHLGEALVRSLVDQHEVVSLDIKPSPFTNTVGSITDRALLKHCMPGVQTVFHTATLHKPHIVTHSMQQFLDTNTQGTLNLLEAAVEANVSQFIFTSTTSVFGEALRANSSGFVPWVTEDLTPIPKNIYGVTKYAAENLCRLIHRKHGLPCIILRTSRFFPEEDDDRNQRQAFSDDNLKANEFLFRRVDVQDIVDAHCLAQEKASSIGFGKYVISATTPFRYEDCNALRTNAASVVEKRVPEYREIYQQLGWKMFNGIDRVYVNDHARRALGWQPTYNFAHVLRLIERNEEPRSPLAKLVGAKGYHDEHFEEGPYPVE